MPLCSHKIFYIKSQLLFFTTFHYTFTFELIHKDFINLLTRFNFFSFHFIFALYKTQIFNSLSTKRNVVNVGQVKEDTKYIKAEIEKENKE